MWADSAPLNEIKFQQLKEAMAFFTECLFQHKQFYDSVSENGVPDLVLLNAYGVDKR